nr:hypothetical protein BaRGS_016399 [Batillaria attramentaria]
MAIAKLYLYAPSSGLYSCPLAMADGAAKIIEFMALLHGVNVAAQVMALLHGVNVASRGTETVAIEQPDGTYRLYGYKWFSSATDADMTFTLARIADKEGNTVEGTRGLSLFYLELRAPDGKLNNIQIQKLKNKLGTRQLPTAELLLDGSTAFRVSDEGRGVAGISNMLTLTRLHNSLSAASSMRRMVNMARDYSTRRSAFGSVLKDYPLHIQTLARMEVLTIWEGTTNVLSLDVLRAMAKSRGGVLKAFAENVGTRLQSAAGREELVGSTNKVAKGAEDVLAFAAKNTSILETAARDFAFSIARVAIAVLCIVP